MEYTFKNSPTEKAVSVVLLEDQMICHTAGTAPEPILYERINRIRLFRENAGKFSLYIYPEKRSPICVGNRYCLSRRESEDRSRRYATFVRVLHMYLEKKGNTAFTTGYRPAAVVMRTIVTALLAFLIAVAIASQFPEFVYPFWLGITWAVVGAVFILLIERNRLPRDYQATDIPPDFLP